MDSMCVTEKFMEIKNVMMKEAEISCVLIWDVSHAEGSYAVVLLGDQQLTEE